MTLLDLATTVCARLLKTDDASLEACKGFLRTRHTLLWDAFLWKDSLVIYHDLPVPKDASGEYRGDMVLPYAVARPILAYDYSNKMLMTPGTLIDLARAGDGAPITDGDMLGFVELAATGLPVPYDGVSVSVRFTGAGADSASTVEIMHGGERDDNLIGTDSSSELSESVTTTTIGAAAFVTLEGPVVRMTKPVTSSKVTVDVLDSDSRATKWYWPASSTTAEFCRIRLLDRPTVAQYGSDLRVGVVGKRKPRSFRNDADSPALRGCEAALLAMATGDMLERERQYQKAQAKFAEGAALVDVMKDGERNQSAFVQRLVPEVPTHSGGREDFGW